MKFLTHPLTLGVLVYLAQCGGVLGDCVKVGEVCNPKDKSSCCEGFSCVTKKNEARCYAYDRNVGDACGDDDPFHKCISLGMTCADKKCAWKPNHCLGKSEKCRGTGALLCCQVHGWNKPPVATMGDLCPKDDVCPCSEQDHGCKDDGDCCDGTNKCLPKLVKDRLSVEKYCMKP